MFTCENSKHFEKHIDESGAVYYLLKTHVAAQQNGFYFVAPCMDEHGRYLWFRCTFPPAMYSTLGVVDFIKDEVHHFPETQFFGETPTVDPLTGDVYYADACALYKRSPNPNVALEKICNLPSELYKRKARVYSAATHLTFSPDRSQLFLDSLTSKGDVLGALTLETGEFELWERPEYHTNHAQFNPVYPGIVLMAEEFDTNEDGSYRSIRTSSDGVFMRLWTITKEEGRKLWAPLNLECATHEWWSADGKKIYYCKYNRRESNNGICAINYFTGEHKLMAPVKAWHGFSSADETLFVFDENDGFYRGCASRVGLYNAKTGKKVYINSQNPEINPKSDPSPYHLDPHPRFNAKEKYITFTTAVYGRPEVAIAKTEDIVELTE